MNLQDYLTLIFIAIAFVSGITLICSIDVHSNKKVLIDSIPFAKQNYVEKIMSNTFIANYLTELSTANGIENDSPIAIIKEVVKSALYGLLFVAVAYVFSYAAFKTLVIGNISIAFMIFLTFWPIIRRPIDKKEYKQKYISAFYVFLNYITLYLSGGVSMRQALIEVNNLTPSNSVIKPRLENIIAKNAISGFNGDTYISTLEELNEGLNFSEITNFIALAKRSQERGDSITDTLLNQLNDISKKVEIDKRSYIAGKENTFEIIKVVFCFFPVILAFTVPIFVSAISAL